MFLGGLFVAFAALVLWLELVVRAAAVSVAVLFLPLALAALVWPSVSHWCRRLADTLVALVLSKLVVAAVLSLAAGAIAGGLGVSPSGAGGGFAAVVTGIALLVIAILAPFTLLRLVPAVEAGASPISNRRAIGSRARAVSRRGRAGTWRSTWSRSSARSPASEEPHGRHSRSAGTGGTAGTAGAASAGAATGGVAATRPALGGAGTAGAGDRPHGRWCGRSGSGAEPVALRPVAVGATDSGRAPGAWHAPTDSHCGRH